MADFGPPQNGLSHLPDRDMSITMVSPRIRLISESCTNLRGQAVDIGLTPHTRQIIDKHDRFDQPILRVHVLISDAPDG